MSLPPERHEFSPAYMGGVREALTEMVGLVHIQGISLPARIIVLLWHEKDESTFVTGAGVRLDEQTGGVQVMTGRILSIPADSSLSQNPIIQDEAASLGVLVCDEKTAQTLVERSGEKIGDHHYRLRANDERDIEIYTPELIWNTWGIPDLSK